MPSASSLPSGAQAEQTSLHVLVICTHFPPLNRTGARRPYYLARQLRDEGHRVSVLTSAETEDATWDVDLSGITVMRCPPSFVQRDMRGWQRLIAKAHHRFQGSFIHGPLRVLADIVLPLDHATRWDVSTPDVEEQLGIADVIMATGPSWSTFEFGMQLSQSWKSTFLVDYRDPWSVNLPDVALRTVTWRGSGIGGCFRRKRTRAVEKRVLSQVNAVTAATSRVLENALHNHTAVPSLLVHNGFDSVPATWKARGDNQLRLLYSGRLYEEQEWELVSDALHQLHIDHPLEAARTELKILGAQTTARDILPGHLSCPDCFKMVEYAENVGREAALGAQRSADLLLHLGFRGKQGIIPLKFYEYLSAGRPIVQDSSSVTDPEAILKETKAGIVLHSPADLVSHLLKMIVLLDGQHPLPYNPDQKALAKYEWSAQMGRWAAFVVRIHFQRHDRKAS
jgi:hypothetical protein